MTITRRALLNTFAAGAGAAVLHRFGVHAAAAQDTDSAVLSALRDDLRRHAGFGRKFSGGPGDRATAEWIAGRLRRAGYRVEQSEFDAPFFAPRNVRFSAGAASVAVMAQAPVLTTSPAGVRGPLTLVENSVGDVRGKIALVVAPFARHAALFPTNGVGRTVLAAAESGATAIVIVTTGPTGEAIALNAPEARPFANVPTAILAPKEAPPFVAAARTGGDATLVVEGEATHRPCPNVVARLERGDRWIAISTPRSGWFDCVGERGTGTAVFLDLAPR